MAALVKLVDKTADPEYNASQRNESNIKIVDP